MDIVLESSTDALGVSSASAAYLSITGVELVPCDDAGATLDWKQLFSVRTAWAHATNTPTRLGIPALDVVAGGPRTVTLGTLAPPAITFCNVRVTFGPADADAVGMPPDHAAVGRTLWVTGRAKGASTDFKLTTSETRSITLPVSPFRAGEHDRRSIVRLSRPGGDALAGVDLAASAIAEASGIVLDRLVDATHAEVQ